MKTIQLKTTMVCCIQVKKTKDPSFPRKTATILKFQTRMLLKTWNICR